MIIGQGNMAKDISDNRIYILFTRQVLTCSPDRLVLTPKTQKLNPVTPTKYDMTILNKAMPSTDNLVVVNLKSTQSDANNEPR